MADKVKQTASSSGSVESEKKKIKAKIDPRIEQKINELRRRAKEALSSKQFEESLRCLDLAIELHSTSYKLYRMRSIALSCLQQYEKAAADADRVVELAPHITDGHYHKGFALFHLKDYAGAAHAFQQGLKLNPTDKTLRQGFWDAIALVSQTRTDTGADGAAALPDRGPEGMEALTASVAAMEVGSGASGSLSGQVAEGIAALPEVETDIVGTPGNVSTSGGATATAGVAAAAGLASLSFSRVGSASGRGSGTAMAETAPAV